MQIPMSCPTSKRSVTDINSSCTSKQAGIIQCPGKDSDMYSISQHCSRWNLLSLLSSWLSADRTRGGDRARLPLRITKASRRNDKGVGIGETIMAKSVNKVILLGNVGKDPEIRS